MGEERDFLRNKMQYVPVAIIDLCIEFTLYFFRSFRGIDLQREIFQ